MNDYVVSGEIKKLQAVQLDILEHFMAVCQKHKIRYYAAGGTLLGAARHKGFIPWDDDIDVQMMWGDYLKLMQVAPDEFIYPYYFQTYQTDTFGEVTCNRLRRSDTTGFTRWELENVHDPNYNKGIYIDVFPMFPVPKNLADREIQKVQIMSYWRALRGWNALQNEKAGKASAYVEYIDDYMMMSKKKSLSQIKQMYLDACNGHCEDYEEIGATSFRTFNEKLMWKKEWFEETVELPFEHITIMCPARYDEVLTKQYGDWRTPVYNGAYHDLYMWDPEVPYMEKLKQTK